MLRRTVPDERRVSPRAPKGPRPQRVEVEDTIDAAVERAVKALGGGVRAREIARTLVLEALELFAVDTAGVFVSSKRTPKAVRVRQPGHDEDV